MCERTEVETKNTQQKGVVVVFVTISLNYDTAVVINVYYDRKNMKLRLTNHDNPDFPLCRSVITRNNSIQTLYKKDLSILTANFDILYQFQIYFRYIQSSYINFILLTIKISSNWYWQIETTEEKKHIVDITFVAIILCYFF